MTVDDAYAEACKALGEAIVNQRLIAAELKRVQVENEQLHGLLGGPPEEPAID